MNWDGFRRQAFPLTLVIASFLCPIPAMALEDDELPEFTEDDIFIDIPQVVSATHLSQKLTEAPAAITIIDRAMIDASGALKVSDLFRLVPGMQAYDVHTNKHGVTYHGMSDDFPNKLEVMINGRSVYLPLLSTVAWETMGLTVDDIDYIEVVRGSNVPTHGSNAFLGAINIITRSPIKDHKSEFRTTQGSLDTQNYTMRHAGSTDQAQYAISAGYESNHGIERFNDSGTSRYLNFSASLTPSLSDNIDIELGFSNGFAMQGDGDEETAVEADFSRRKHDANYQLIRWNRILDAHKELSITYYHNYLNLDAERYTDEELQTLLEELRGLPLPPGTGQQANLLNPLGVYKDSEHGQMDLHDFEVLQISELNQNSNVALGAGIRFQRVQSEPLFSTPSGEWNEELRYRLFSNWEYRPFEKWVFNSGAMLEHSSIVGTAFSPRIATNYLIDNSSSIRAAYTVAHRMPSLLDAEGNSRLTYPLGAGVDVITEPNPDIKPEKNHSFELGYIKLWPQNTAQFETRIFYEDITDAIHPEYISSAEDTRDNESRIQSNLSSWINRGFEFQLKSDLPILTNSFFVLNYAYNNPKGLRNRGLNGSDSLDKRAPHAFSIPSTGNKPNRQKYAGYWLLPCRPYRMVRRL